MGTRSYYYLLLDPAGKLSCLPESDRRNQVLQRQVEGFGGWNPIGCWPGRRDQTSLHSQASEVSESDTSSAVR